MFSSGIHLKLWRFEDLRRLFTTKMLYFFMVCLLWWIVTTQKLPRRENHYLKLTSQVCKGTGDGNKMFLKGVQKTKISDILIRSKGILMKKLKGSTGEIE